MERVLAHERKSDIRSTRTRRSRSRVQKKAAPVQVPLQYRAAFANYLLHGMSPEEARTRVFADMDRPREVV